MCIQLLVMLLVMVVGRRARGQTAVKASHNIEEVPYEECQTVKASVGLGQGVVFFLMVGFQYDLAHMLGQGNCEQLTRGG